jgi:glycosyltransferase involved in cell wall biosynthesis
VAVATECPKVSVVIPVRNGATTIRDQLDALASQEFQDSWETVVVDNGSTDNIAAAVGEFSNRLPCLRLIDAGERPGINHARNVGARSARGSLVLFCDADDVVGKGWLMAMVTGLGQYDSVGGTLNGTHGMNADSAARLIVDPEPASPGLPISKGFLPRPPGGNCGIRSDVFHSLGGFNEDFAGGGDETEFFWRLQLSGRTLGFVPNALVYVRYRSRLMPALKALYRKSRSGPQLYKQFRTQGMPSASVLRQLRAWGVLLARSHWLIAGKRKRIRWLGQAVRLLGRLSGSLRYRVLYL